MGGEWEKVKVLDIADRTSTGPFGSAIGSDFFQNWGIPLIRGSNLSQDIGIRLKEDDYVFVSEEKANEFKRSQVKQGDLVFTCWGTIDQIGLIDKNSKFKTYIVSNKQMLLSPNRNRADSLFLYYVFSSSEYKNKIINEGIGSSVPGFNLGQLRSFELKLPSLHTQRRIASILGSLDDKIELNRQMNATMEEMARAFFQSWFVDFDPVHAKAQGKQPVGMDAETAALFPDSFVGSIIGKIPKNWKVGNLDGLTKYVIGGDWGSTEVTEEESICCFCIRGADIPSLQSGGVGKMPIRFLKPSSVEKRKLGNGDLVIEISGGSPTQCTGRPVLISSELLLNLSQPLIASNFCRILKLQKPAYSKFVYLWLRHLYDAGELSQYETGTTGIKNFAFAIFSEKYPLVIANDCVFNAFDKTVSNYFAKIQSKAQESRDLSSLRDTLLPKLLSGELAVSDAEQMVKDTSHA